MAGRLHALGHVVVAQLDLEAAEGASPAPRTADVVLGVGELPWSACTAAGVDTLVSATLEDPALDTTVRLAARRRRDLRAAEAELEATRSALTRSDDLGWTSAAMLRETPLVTYAKDPQLRFILTNKRHSELIGLAPSAILGKTDTDLFGEEARTIEEASRNVLSSGEPAHHHFDLTVGGEQRTFHETIFVLRDDDGHVRGLGGIAHDFTEKLRTERELQRLGVTLQKLVEDSRTLEAAKNAAEEATRAKTAFLANMSHEIRTPMNAVLGLSSIVLRGTLEPRQRDYVEKLHREGSKLLRILDDVLDFSRLDAGRVDIEHIPFSVAKLLDETLALFREGIEAAGLTVALEADTALPAELLGDPGRIGQILTNLLANALKFTPRGQIGLAARVRAAEAERTLVEFSVSDTGIGMSKEESARVFEAFCQADASTTRRFGGTGLGLTISRRLAEAMGGGLEVESVKGAGSTFRFALWLDAGRPASAPILSEPPPSRLAGLRVLLAEDNLVNAEITLSLLESEGVVVEHVENGALAVERVRSGEKYDVVLMDLQMPVMDGLRATREIRAAGYSSLPIIALTAHALDEQRGEAFAAGMNDYATKPIEPEVLLHALRRWSSARPALAPSAENARDAEARSPASDPRRGLEAIPGLDVTAGLSQTGGQESVLRAELHQLASDQAGLEGLREALNAERWAEVAERASKLRALAQRLGLVEIARVAGKVERAASRGWVDGGDGNALVVLFENGAAGIRRALGPAA